METWTVTMTDPQRRIVVDALLDEYARTDTHRGNIVDLLMRARNPDVAIERTSKLIDEAEGRQRDIATLIIALGGEPAEEVAP